MTFGIIETSPGSNNTVPGRLRMTVDIRHPQEESYRALVSESYELVKQACDKWHLSHQMGVNRLS